MRALRILLVLVMLTVACGEERVVHETAMQPIVNGQEETGWEGVGALTFHYPGYGYMGSYCTGTLIAPQWVLTAAHCLEKHEDFDLWPELVKFYVGTNANPYWAGGEPTSGELYQADAFYKHPQYNPNWTSNDIGLVHLAEPATGVPTTGINTSYMSGSWIGDQVLYVGFGVTDGINQGGSGIKRSATLDIYDVNQKDYVSKYEGEGVCFGDSGGPGLKQVSGSWKVIGVNSTVGAQSGDPCKGFSTHTRVDTYSDWIYDKLNAAPPSCTNNVDMCFCPEACQGGTCNNDVCKTLTCKDIYMCMVDCGQNAACQKDCYLQGTDDGVAILDAMFKCFYLNCEDATDAEYQDCVSDNCQVKIDNCMPLVTGDMDCEQAYNCLVECPQSDQNCQYECFESATAEAQAQLNDMFECLDDSCGNLSNPDQYSACAFEHCSGEINTCMPPTNCDIMGGDCGTGKACYPMSASSTECYPTDGLGLGESCDPDATNQLQCQDGLVCVGGANGAFCYSFCKAESDCPEEEWCWSPVFQGIPTLGICICTDEDLDGYCAEEDCDDKDASVHPGVDEMCDEIDNDCDGGIDEGCPGGCTDGDNDGVCTPQDCDDDNPSVFPGVDEVCDDVDNNCDGTIDEGCGGPQADVVAGEDSLAPGADTEDPGTDPVTPGDETVKSSSSSCSHGRGGSPLAGGILILAILGLAVLRRTATQRA